MTSAVRSKKLICYRGKKYFPIDRISQICPNGKSQNVTASRALQPKDGDKTYCNVCTSQKKLGILRL